MKKRLFINDKPTRYIIGDDGTVFSEITNKYLKPFRNPSGYYLVDISCDGLTYTRQLHRLIAIAFIPNPFNLDTVNHIDGDKSNNSASNLEWMSIGDNVRHAWKNGLVQPRYGVDNPANVYTEDQIHKVCQMLEVGDMNYKKIAQECGVNVTLIYDIRLRGKWKQISSLYDIPTNVAGHKELRQPILDLMSKGYSNQEIIDMLGLPETFQKHIKYVRSIYKRSLNDYP